MPKWCCYKASSTDDAAADDDAPVMTGAALSAALNATLGGSAHKGAPREGAVDVAMVEGGDEGDEGAAVCPGITRKDVKDAQDWMLSLL